MNPEDVASALDVTFSEMISWVADELNAEQSDILEVALSMLELRSRRRRLQDEPTLRLRVA